MFKKILLTTALIGVIGLLVFGAVNRTMAKNPGESTDAVLEKTGQYSSQATAGEPSQNETIMEKGKGGRGQGQGASGADTLVPTQVPSEADEATALEIPRPAATEELSAEEAAALMFMREEEKLAHDLYLIFYAQWGLPVFQNISQSEQAHIEAVKGLLEKYGLTDPAASQAGVFTNPELQALYNELAARGSQSLGEALKVGAAVEEIDILDLEERLGQTDNADIQQVFGSLLRGSQNHLRSFVSTLSTQTGESYQPQYLSLEAYQAIISANSGNGNGRGGRGTGGGGGGRP